jgi:Rod binding domain-containing protein
MEMKVNPAPSSGRRAIPQPGKEEQQLKAKCREFEAVLLKQLVEAMQGETGLFGQGVQGDYFRSLFAEEMAKELAKDPGMGLAESLYRALAASREEEQPVSLDHGPDR